MTINLCTVYLSTNNFSPCAMYEYFTTYPTFNSGFWLTVSVSNGKFCSNWSVNPLNIYTVSNVHVWKLFLVYICYNIKLISYPQKWDCIFTTCWLVDWFKANESEDSVGFLFVFNKIAHLSVRAKVKENEVKLPLPSCQRGHQNSKQGRLLETNL